MIIPKSIRVIILIRIFKGVGRTGQGFFANLRQGSINTFCS
jgi:hypothetical protein